MKLLVLAIVIILLILIIYKIIFNKRISAKERIRKLLNKSAIFDNNAKEAMTILKNTKKLTPEEYIRTADIIRFNINDDKPGPHMIEVTNLYLNGLNGLNHQNENVEEPEQNEYRPTFILDHIFNTINIFANEYEKQMAEAIERSLIQQRMDDSKEKTKIESINKFLDSSIVYTNDPQNVHDSNVNNDLKIILEKIKIPVSDELMNKSIEEARAHVVNNKSDKIINVNKVLDKIEEDLDIYTFNDSEKRIFTYVWNRSNDERNDKNTIRDAIINSLDDCIENNLLVCINGRCGRIINSLATIDYDSTISGAMTYESYKNQIYNEVKNIIDAKLIEYKNGNSLMKTIASVYEGSDEPDTTEYKLTLDKFKKDIKEEIDILLLSYKDKIPYNKLDKIKQNCYIYADF